MSDVPPETNQDPLARMADDLERIAAHLVPFLKASYNDTQERLKRAERVIASRQERPAIVGMHRLLSALRRLDGSADVPEFAEEGLATLLNELGYQEFGSPGDPYDPVRHEPVSGQTERGRGQIARVHRRGLACHGDVIVRAVVDVMVEDAPEASPEDSPLAPSGAGVGDAFPMPGKDMVAPAAGPFDQSTEGR